MEQHVIPAVGIASSELKFQISNSKFLPRQESRRSHLAQHGVNGGERDLRSGALLRGLGHSCAPRAIEPPPPHPPTNIPKTTLLLSALKRSSDAYALSPLLPFIFGCVNPLPSAIKTRPLTPTEAREKQNAGHLILKPKALPRPALYCGGGQCECAFPFH